MRGGAAGSVRGGAAGTAGTVLAGAVLAGAVLAGVVLAGVAGVALLAFRGTAGRSLATSGSCNLNRT